MCGCVAEQLDVVGRVLVVAGDEQVPDFVQEGLAGFVIGQQGFFVDEVQAALLAVGEGAVESVGLGGV